MNAPRKNSAVLDARAGGSISRSHGRKAVTLMGRPKGEAQGPIILYSIWRNSDDRLLVLDGTAKQCCHILGITMHTFYGLVSRNASGEGKYTVRKIKASDAKREEES